MVEKPVRFGANRVFDPVGVFKGPLSGPAKAPDHENPPGLAGLETGKTW